MSEENETLSSCREFIESSGIDTSNDGWKTKLPAPPPLPFDSDKDYYWEIETNKGSLKVKLWPHIAPQHVSSTIYLTTLGFYDDLAFHRVIKGFMAQGGCPEGRGTGGPGFQYDGELSPEARHDRPGLLSMANAGPGTDGSQFFLTFVPTPWLDDKHTIFGKLVEGFQPLTFIQNAGSKDGTPTEEILINKSFIETR